jgi:hypothetical protein
MASFPQASPPTPCAHLYPPDNKTTRHKIRYNVKVRGEKMKHEFQKNLKLRKCKTYKNLTLVLWAFGQYLRKSA